MKQLMLPFVALAIMTGCTNTDGTMGQRGSLAWYEQSTPQQKQVYFRGICLHRYGLDDGKEMNTCVQDIDTTYAIKNGDILLCPLTKSQLKNGNTCQSTIPKYGPDFMF